MSGGFRPGAGGKRKETVVEQGTRRDIVLDVVSQQLWRKTVTEWIATARTTKNFALLFPLLPYIMGAAKQEIAITFDVQEAAADLAAQYGVPPERVVSLVERLKAKRAG